MSGNTRYVSGLRDHMLTMAQGTNAATVAALADHQNPFAVVITCSDSRVVPEALFSCGLGSLFVIRNAGNTIGPAVVASVEYAVSVLHTPLVVVLGHLSCGAVTATVSAVAEDAARSAAAAAARAARSPEVADAGAAAGSRDDAAGAASPGSKTAPSTGMRVGLLERIEPAARWALEKTGVAMDDASTLERAVCLAVHENEQVQAARLVAASSILQAATAVTSGSEAEVSERARPVRVMCATYDTSTGAVEFDTPTGGNDASTACDCAT